MSNHIIAEIEELENEQVQEEELRDEEGLQDEPEGEETQEENVEGSDEDEEEIPEKFRGKSLKDIVRSYQELERAHGRQANDLGELRKLADQYLRQELPGRSTAKQQEEEVKLEFGDFVENPQAAVDKALSPKIKQLDERISQYEMKMREAELAKKHPDYRDVASEEGFVEWVKSSPYRLRLFQEADRNYDFNAADELLTEYKERKEFMATKESKAKSKEKRKRDLKASVVESGSSGETTKKVYRRSDLIKLRIENPDKYDAMYDEIARAYREGRVR